MGKWMNNGCNIALCSIIFPSFSDVFFFFSPMGFYGDFPMATAVFFEVFAPQGINEGVAQALVRYAAWKKALSERDVVGTVEPSSHTWIKGYIYIYISISICIIWYIYIILSLLLLLLLLLLLYIYMYNIIYIYIYVSTCWFGWMEFSWLWWDLHRTIVGFTGFCISIFFVILMGFYIAIFDYLCRGMPGQSKWPRMGTRMETSGK